MFQALQQMPSSPRQLTSIRMAMPQICLQRSLRGCRSMTATECRRWMHRFGHIVYFTSFGNDKPGINIVGLNQSTKKNPGGLVVCNCDNNSPPRQQITIQKLGVANLTAAVQGHSDVSDYVNFTVLWSDLNVKVAGTLDSDDHAVFLESGNWPS